MASSYDANGNILIEGDTVLYDPLEDGTFKSRHGRCQMARVVSAGGNSTIMVMPEHGQFTRDLPPRRLEKVME